MLQILNLPASLQNKNTRIGPFPWKRPVLQNPDRERINQSTGICLRLGLPYNNCDYLISNGNRTEWSKIHGVIGRVISNQPSAWLENDLKLRARFPLNCTTRSPVTN